MISRLVFCAYSSGLHFKPSQLSLKSGLYRPDDCHSLFEALKPLLKGAFSASRIAGLIKLIGHMQSTFQGIQKRTIRSNKSMARKLMHRVVFCCIGDPEKGAFESPPARDVSCVRRAGVGSGCSSQCHCGTCNDRKRRLKHFSFGSKIQKLCLSYRESPVALLGLGRPSELPGAYEHRNESKPGLRPGRPIILLLLLKSRVKLDADVRHVERWAEVHHSDSSSVEGSIVSHAGVTCKAVLA